MSSQLQLQFRQAIILDGHPQPIAAKEVGRLDPQRSTLHRLELEAASSPRNFPKIVIIKQQKDGWEEEFQREKTAYKRLENLQGKVIPRLLGEGFFDDRSAIILSEIVGKPLDKLARDDTIEADEEALQAGLVDALQALFVRGAKYWDQRPDSFLFCAVREPGQGKVMIVDLEQVTFPEDSPPGKKLIKPGKKA